MEKIFIHIFILLSSCFFIFQSYDIQRVENYQIFSFNYNKIFEFNIANYFQNERSYINIIKRNYNKDSRVSLYIYYDINKIEVYFIDVRNYDEKLYLDNYLGKIIQINLNITSPFIYLVFDIMNEIVIISPFKFLIVIHTQIFQILIFNLALVKYHKSFLIFFFLFYYW